MIKILTSRRTSGLRMTEARYMKIIITGGHVTPALAVIDLLAKSDHVIIFVGRKHALSGDRSESFEFQEIQKRHIQFIDLRAGRLSMSSFRNLLLIPSGFIEAFKLLKKQKPDVILSFGGYIALPVAFCGWIQKIPVVTHEQTIAPGITSKLIARFAKFVCITFPQTSRFFNKKNTIITGNPIRSAIFNVDKKPFHIEKTGKKVLYVTGGSLGSHAINLAVAEIMHSLLKKYIVIHQCGSTTEFDDFKHLSRIKAPNYHVAKHFLDDEIGYIYNCADIVIARSGANTILELIALKKPAVLIPLPIARHDEQLKHAKLLEKAGAAVIYDQEKESHKLLESIDHVAVNYAAHEKSYDSLRALHKKDAAQTIIKAVLSLARQST